MTDSGFDFFVKTTVHLQDINKPDKECITDTSFHTLHFTDIPSIEKDLMDYCNKIRRKGRVKRVVDITIEKLPLPLLYIPSDYKNEEATDNSVDSSEYWPKTGRQSDFNNLVSRITEYIIHQLQLETNEDLNIQEKIIYGLDSNFD